ncbi:MAG TPA: hypothetical protein VNH22_08545, partial [Blastocatellia bacterium]|nr:hypothetical protein [Blastocatellia bacterium]
MQKEELLNLLSTEARGAFESAKRLAASKGGTLSPLHIVVGVLERLPLALDGRGLMLEAAAEALSRRFPGAAASIVISKETQTVIAEAGRLAQEEGAGYASLAHLLRAALASDTVRQALDGDGFALKAEAMLAQLRTRPARADGLRTL